MTDEQSRTNDGQLEGSGLTKVKPGEASHATGQGGTGASRNAQEDRPDSAREQVLGQDDSEPREEH